MFDLGKSEFICYNLSFWRSFCGMEMKQDDIPSLLCFSPSRGYILSFFTFFIYFFFVRLGNGEDLTLFLIVCVDVKGSGFGEHYEWEELYSGP